MSEEGQDGAASGIGAWVKQFDPQANKHYYWHPDTDECVWEQPPDFVAGTSDSRVEAATKIQSAMRGASSRHNLKHHWHKAFDPQSNAFYYWDAVTGETVWEEPEGYVALAVPKNLRATMVMQRMARKWLAKLRVAHMRKEREKRRQREHKQRLADDHAVRGALKDADKRAAMSRTRENAELRYLSRSNEDDKIAADESITDWKEMRDMHGNMFYFSPSTGKTTKTAPMQFVEVKAGPTALDMLALEDDGDEDDDGEEAMGWKLHDHSARAMQMIKDLDTNEWMQHDWVKPSVAQAIEHRHEMVFHGGNAPIWHTGHYQLAAKLGDGISLYFRLLSYLGWLFMLMMIVALPSLGLNLAGSRIEEDEVDPLGLAYTTIGNLGFSDADIVDGIHCPRIVDDCNNQSYVLFFGQPIVLANAAQYTALLDLLNCVLFWGFLVFFRFRIKSLVEQHKSHHITATNYAVHVSGLPRDAGEEEIRAFFSDLYNLARVDWSAEGFCCGLCGAKRPRNAVLAEEPIRLEDRGEIDAMTGLFKPKFHQSELDHQRYRRWAAEDVRNTTNTGNPKYKGGWVAEVSVVHPNGDAIRRYLKLKKIQMQILNQKQMYLKHKDGTLDLDDKVRKKAMKRTAKALAKVTRLQQKMKKVTGGMEHTLHSNECIGAYVVFNEEDSMFRCLDDYHHFSGVRTLCMPRQMRFRGKHRLKVSQATEPSAIVWQNLDTPIYNKCMRRALALVAMVVLLTVSLIALFAAAAAKTEASKNLPDFALCRTLPDLAFAPSAPPSTTTLRRVRSLDDECGANKFFVSYDPAPYGIAYADAVSRDYSAEPCADPCVEPDNRGACTTSAELNKATRIGCYCKAILSAKVADMGVFDALSEMNDEELDLCGSFLADFSLTNALVIVSAVVIVFVNAVLRYLLKAISRFERHDTLSAESKSETLKIFLAQFINTAIIALLVNTKAPDLVVIPGLGLFEGQFDDFTPSWYAAVGAPIMLTMLLNVVSPHVMPLLKWLIIQPVRTWWARKTYASQEYLNSVYEGPDFSIATRYPIALNTLFVCMMFSSAMPILYLVGACAFWSTYWIDKISLLRLYNRPPRYDESLALIASELMPLSLLFHMAIAIWSYGNGVTLESSSLAGSVTDAIDTSDVQFGDRLTRSTTIGVFLALLAVLLWWASISFAKNLFHTLIMIITCGRGFASHNEDKRTADIRPPYTQVFREVLTPYETAALDMRSEAMTEKDKEMLDTKSYKKHGGRWDVVPEPDGTRVRWRKWVDNGRKNGIRHKRGDRMLTWEVIRENALHSYKIMNNKKYRRALAAMMADDPTRFNLLLVKKSKSSRSNPTTPKGTPLSPVSESPHSPGRPTAVDTEEEQCLAIARSELVVSHEGGTPSHQKATFHALQHSKRFLGVPASSASSKSVVGMAGHNRVAPSVVIQVESDSKRSLEDGGGVEEAKNNGDHVTVLDAVGERESKGTPGPPPATASPPPQDSPGVGPQRPGSPSQPAHMPGAVHVPGGGAGAAALADPVGSPHSTTSPADPLLAAPTGDGRNRLPPAVP